ncbi:unnamed protein product [Sphagnum troendelagicum]
MGLVTHNGVLRRLQSRSQQLSAVSPLCPEGPNLVDNDNRLLPVTESNSRLVYPVEPDSRPELSAQLEHVTSSQVWPRVPRVHKLVGRPSVRSDCFHGRTGSPLKFACGTFS